MDDKSNVSPKPTLHLIVPQACRVCETNTFKCCERCKDFLAGTGQSGSLAYYCSTKCQAEDLPKHKERCNLMQNRGILYRTVQFLHALFTMTRNVAFNIPIESVQQDHDSKGRLVVQAGPAAPSGKERSSIFALDGSQFKSADDQLMMLTWRASALAVNRMYPLLKAYLNGLCDELQELVFVLPEDNWCIVVPDAKGENKSDRSNNVFKIKLKKDPVWFVVDLTCNQFGLDEPVMEWSAYKEKVGLTYFSINAGGDTHESFHRELRARYKKLRSDKNYKFTGDELSDLTQSYVTERMYFALGERAKKSEMDVPKALRQADTKRIDDLIEYVAQEVLEFVSGLQKMGGILQLDERVATAKDSKTEQDRTILDFSEWRSHYMA